MSPLGYVLLLGVVGFALGFWAARRETLDRRLTTALIVGLIVSLTPTIVGVIGDHRW